MKPVTATTAITGTTSAPRNEVSQGPRIGLRQNSGRNGAANWRCEPFVGASRDRPLSRSGAGRSGFGDSLTDKVDPYHAQFARDGPGARRSLGPASECSKLNGHGIRFLPISGQWHSARDGYERALFLRG